MKRESTGTKLQPIRARVDEKAIEKVTRFYAGTIDEMLNETFQNARRARATHIDVTLCEDTELGTTIDIHDDGEGIEDPQTLLSFGASAWNADEVGNEDPAGMGFYALARTRCCVTSRATGTVKNSGHAKPVQAWSVWLGPEHFTGTEAATPQSDTTNWEGSGTTVHMRWRATRETVAEAIRQCGRYQNIRIRIDGKTIPQEGFLKDSLYTETWNETSIGVIRTGAKQLDRKAQAICVYGVAVRTKTARVKEVGRRRQWYARVLVNRSNGLELMLPGRKDLVENEWATAMRIRTKEAIYRAIERCGERVTLGRKDRDAAQAAGIALAEPARKLRPWRPETPAEQTTDALWQTRDREIEIGTEALVMTDPMITMHDHVAQVLRRALEAAGDQGEVFTAEPELSGVQWYDRLRKITAVVIEAHDAGRWLPIERWDSDQCAQDATCRRVQGLRARCTLNDGTQISFATDIGFARPSGQWNALRGTLIAAQTPLKAAEIEQRMVDTLFIPDEGWDSGSWEMHQRQFETEAAYEARCLLEGKAAAATIALENATDEHLVHFAPKDARTVIIIENGRVEVEIENRGQATE